MTQMKNVNKRFALIAFAREQAECLLMEAEKLAKMDSLPNEAKASPVIAILYDGTRTIGARCNITFSFGTYDIEIFKNADDQLIIRDKSRSFAMRIDYCEELDDYDFDNAYIEG